MDICIYSLTSSLHDENSTNKYSNDFLNRIKCDFIYKGQDFTDFGEHTLDLIYVRTGGTEGIFKQLLPQLKTKTKIFYLLTSGASNSLAASMEILSYLNSNNLSGEIIHGDFEYINHRIDLLHSTNKAIRKLRGTRLGIIGSPSDWLIASDVDNKKISEKLGIEIINIPIETVIEKYKTVKCSCTHKDLNDPIGKYLDGANKIYEALKEIVAEHSLNGLTIRCFDLLSTIENTACLALARLNAEGIIAGCEGDIPSAITMMFAKVATGFSGFQANPSRINPTNGEMVFAHCTIPLNMVVRYELDTHFESGIGVAIRGYSQTGPVTIFKISGGLDRFFADNAQLISCESKPNLCRTQQLIKLSSTEVAKYFLTNPIGNHHIIVPGHNKELFTGILTNIIMCDN
ncbi:MAG: hypothetical protein KBT10_00665 [Bacteroidales bacterium]|nr:hypothetical protein [Candidatus Sodaliphilus aphodohippi]